MTFACVIAIAGALLPIAQADVAGPRLTGVEAVRVTLRDVHDLEWLRVNAFNVTNVYGEFAELDSSPEVRTRLSAV